MSDIYVNWWLGGIALGVLTVMFRLLTGNTLGVSGSWRKVSFWRQESANDKAVQALEQDQAGAANALMAATMAEFGGEAMGADSDAVTPTHKVRAGKQAVPWTAHLLFLLGLALGGLLWAGYSGNLHLVTRLSEIHSKISGNFRDMSFMLLVGGFLVGMGTQMAGGCSSGHGLSGCSNFSWSSMLATGIFFVTAVIVANAIKMVM